MDLCDLVSHELTGRGEFVGLAPTNPSILTALRSLLLEDPIMACNLGAIEHINLFAILLLVVGNHFGSCADIALSVERFLNVFESLLSFDPGVP